jgi:hypothetical protein
MMTKKDYILLAKAILLTKSDLNVAGRETTGINMVARNVANTLAQDNPRFDRVRFLAACGVS